LSDGLFRKSKVVGVLRKILQQINSQVPTKRISLRELLTMQEPGYTGRDGTKYVIAEEELSAVKDALTRRGHWDVKLPILLMAESSQEQSTWKVEGEVECAVVSQVLEREETGPRSPLYLYAPHIAALRRKLPTATACMFMP
jgi:uncharacterized protein (UPF0216 family)